MLEPGIKGFGEETVTQERSAKAIGSGELSVYATPALIALAEKTAWQSVADHLEEGCGTVGTRMNLSHLAATPVGMHVTCETELTEVDRRRLVFSVLLFDEAGKIAEGEHERFVINNEKFEEKAYAKLSPAES